ncbi:MAG: hypothetical protein ACOVNU_10550 [Candidatus Kapaibacteriota bacterium]
MYKFMKMLLVVTLFMITTNLGNAQSPQGKTMGVGVMLGDANGATLKLWQGGDVAYNIYLTNSFFGNITIGADYMKHFNAFNSKVFNLHLAGGALIGTGKGGGIGYRDYNYTRSGSTGIALRGMLGVNYIPNNTPLEVTAEIGPLLSLTPGFGMFVMADFGVRLYL